MLKYVQKVDEETKQCFNVGDGTDSDFYKSIGMTEQEVEQAYTGSWYLVGYAPKKPEPTIKEQNEAIRKQREAEYQSLTDPLTLRKMRKDALGEWTPDDEKQYLDELRRISDEINAKYPYVEEIGNV